MSLKPFLDGASRPDDEDNHGNHQYRADDDDGPDVGRGRLFNHGRLRYRRRLREGNGGLDRRFYGYRRFGGYFGCYREVGYRGPVTGGRGKKGDIYEGGLRVPALLEWPAVLRQPRATDVPCNTSDIYPTLLQIAGVTVDNQPPLDGISLVPLIEGRMTSRPMPMGFWDHPTPGVGTPSKEWMASLLEAQNEGRAVDDSSRLRLDAGEITRKYPEDHFPGHAAWLDWPWKLHRMEKDDRVTFELYNLARDPQEADDLLERDPELAAAMKTRLEAWLASVVRSLNGADYR